MQTGVLTSDNLSQVLRGIAQRRQQGVLELRFPEEEVQIFFVQGKVVDVQRAGSDAVAEVLHVLQAGEVIAADAEYQERSYGDLFARLQEDKLENGEISREQFKKVLQHAVLNRLYALDLSVGAHFSFRVQLVEIDRDLAPAISVGQLLLDLVALAGEAARFEEVMDPEYVVVQGLHKGQPLIEEEQLIYDLAHSPITVAELMRRSMLSVYRAQESILNLYEREILILADEAGEERPEAAAIDDISALLEQSVGVFAEVEDVDVPQVEAGAAAPAQAPLEVEEEESYFPDISAALGLWNAKLLHKNWAPHLVTFLFLVAACAAPLLWWSGVFREFGRF